MLWWADQRNKLKRDFAVGISATVEISILRSHTGELHTKEMACIDDLKHRHRERGERLHQHEHFAQACAVVRPQHETVYGKVKDDFARKSSNFVE